MSKDLIPPRGIVSRTHGLSEPGLLIAFENPSGSLMMSWYLNISKKKKKERKRKKNPSPGPWPNSSSAYLGLF